MTDKYVLFPTFQSDCKKYLKIRTLVKFAVIILKVEQFDFMIRVMCPEDVDGMANRVDLDQTI